MAVGLHQIPIHAKLAPRIIGYLVHLGAVKRRRVALRSAFATKGTGGPPVVMNGKAVRWRDARPDGFVFVGARLLLLRALPHGASGLVNPIAVKNRTLRQSGCEPGSGGGGAKHGRRRESNSPRWGSRPRLVSVYPKGERRAGSVRGHHKTTAGSR